MEATTYGTTENGHFNIGVILFRKRGKRDREQENNFQFHAWDLKNDINTRQICRDFLGKHQNFTNCYNKSSMLTSKLKSKINASMLTVRARSWTFEFLLPIRFFIPLTTSFACLINHNQIEFTMSESISESKTWTQAHSSTYHPLKKFKREKKTTRVEIPTQTKRTKDIICKTSKHHKGTTYSDMPPSGHLSSFLFRVNMRSEFGKDSKFIRSVPLYKITLEL